MVAQRCGGCRSSWTDRSWRRDASRTAGCGGVVSAVSRTSVMRWQRALAADGRRRERHRRPRPDAESSLRECRRSTSILRPRARALRSRRRVAGSEPPRTMFAGCAGTYHDHVVRGSHEEFLSVRLQRVWRSVKAEVTSEPVRLPREQPRRGWCTPRVRRPRRDMRTPSRWPTAIRSAVTVARRSRRRMWTDIGSSAAPG